MCKRSSPQQTGAPIDRLMELFMKTQKSLSPDYSMRKLPARYAVLVMPFFLSILMTCIVSLISTLRTVGLIEHFLPIWMGSWALSWVVAFPTLLLVLPLVRRLTAMLVEAPR